MVCVFLSFVLGEERVIKEFGLSLASAVFLDALVVRCMLLPATLNIIGRITWSFPAALDRLLPRISVEGELARDAAREHDRHRDAGSFAGGRPAAATDGAEG
jgi:RND superfamily putative drug exporter